MSIVVRTGPNNNSNGGGGGFFNRLDPHMAKTIQCVISNILLDKYGASLGRTVLLNSPLRIWNCVDAYQKREYHKIIFDLAAFATLFLGGRSITVVVDLASEALNLYQKSKSQPAGSSHSEIQHKIDCSIRENALIVLGISEEDSQNRACLDEKYDSLRVQLVARAEDPVTARWLKKELTRMISQVDVSYATLTKS